MDRTAVLMEWARALIRQGEVPPSEQALREIGARGAIPGHLRTPDLDRWARVIQHLLWLVNQRHPNPVGDALRLAPDGPPVPRSQPSAPLHQPSGPAHQPSAPMNQPSGPTSAVSAVPPPAQETPPPAPTSSREQVQELLMWRDGEGLTDLKDRHIRQVVNSEPESVADIAAGLPAALKGLASQIGGILGVGSTPEPSTPDPEQTRAWSMPPSGAGGTPPPPGAPNPGAPNPGITDSHAPDPGATTQLHRSGEPQAQRAHPDPDSGTLTWTDPIELEAAMNEFAPVDLSAMTPDPGRLRAAPTRDGEGVRLTWDPVTAPEGHDHVEYRVVSDDEHAPISPDHADVIGLTGQTVFTDTREFHSAVRHYRVWANTGPSRQAARAEQPVLIAETSVVTRPDDVVIREDEGRVIGQWSLPRGVRRVLVFRVPQERAGAGTGNPEFRICANESNLGGFVDYDAEPGHKYHYQLQVEAEGSSQLSFPTSVPVTTSAVLEPVQDLDCALGDDADAQFALSWTPPPIGHVEIYRTENGPRAGADNETVSEDALPQMGLTSKDLLAHPTQPDGDKARMQEVPWPRGWSRTYFTPVTLLDGQARVGRTISRVRTGSVTDAKLIERVTQQVLTMTWPAGAANVKVYAGPIGQSAEETIASSPPIAEISADAYERFGGLHFPQPLDPLGVDLHLVSVAFTEGTSVEGKPATITYNPLLKIWYHMAIQPGADGRPWAMVSFQSDIPVNGQPPMAMVFNPERLPLDISDGEQLAVMPHSGDQQPTQRFRPAIGTDTAGHWWVTQVPGPRGWLRVFIDWSSEGQTVAVLDPPIENLRMGPMS